MSRRGLHLRLAIVAGLATATAGGCGPEDNPQVSETTTTGESSSAADSDSRTATGAATVDTSGTSSSTSESGSSSDDTSTGTTPTWGRPYELVELTDDGEDLVVFSLVPASDHVHVGALSPNYYTRHWVVDRETGDVGSTSPVGGFLAASAGFVYGTGFRDGGDGTPDAEWSLNRMAHDGAGDTELLVGADAMYVRAASPGGAFVERLVGAGMRELWRADDVGDPTSIGCLGEVDVSLAVFDSDRLLVFDGPAMALSSLDVVSLAVEPLAQLDDPAVALATNSFSLFAATFESMVRVEKNDYTIDVLDTEPASDVAADADAVVWVASSAPGASRIVAADADGTGPVVVWEEAAQIQHVALDSDALYFVRETREVGALVRIDRP